MELDVIKKLIKRYESGHTGFVMECERNERYYRNQTDVLLKKKKEDSEGSVMWMKTKNNVTTTSTA